jgi:hypothetical protein
MEQLMTLSVEPGDKVSAVKYLASLKFELLDEKAARKEAKEVQTLAWAIANLKKTTDKFATQIP